MSIPKAISTSEINFGGFIMHVYQLDNGQQVIDAEDVEKFFNPDSNVVLTPEIAVELASLLRGTDLPTENRRATTDVADAPINERSKT